MSEIVNLNKARKARARQADKAAAAENRVRFGRTKGQKAIVEAEIVKLGRTLDHAKRED